MGRAGCGRCKDAGSPAPGRKEWGDRGRGSAKRLQPPGAATGFRARTPGADEGNASGGVRRTAGVRPEIEIVEPLPDAASFLYTKYGASQGRRMVYVFFQEQHKQAHLRFKDGFFKSDRLTDLISGKEHRLTPAPSGGVELRIPCPTWRFAVLVEEEMT